MALKQGCKGSSSHLQFWKRGREATVGARPTRTARSAASAPTTQSCRIPRRPPKRKPRCRTDNWASHPLLATEIRKPRSNALRQEHRRLRKQSRSCRLYKSTPDMLPTRFLPYSPTYAQKLLEKWTLILRHRLLIRET